MLIRLSILGIGYTRKYSIDNYRSMGEGFLDGGPDYGSHDSMVTHFVHYSFILYGKKGVSDLNLYSVSGGRHGFFPAERKFRKVADLMLKHLPLKQERYGP